MARTPEKSQNNIQQLLSRPGVSSQFTMSKLGKSYSLPKVLVKLDKNRGSRSRFNFDIAKFLLCCLQFFYINDYLQYALLFLFTKKPIRAKEGFDNLDLRFP